MKKYILPVLAIIAAILIWRLVVSYDSATLKFHESKLPVSAVCGGDHKIFLASPNTLFTRYVTSAKVHSKTTIVISTKPQGSDAIESKPLTELPGVVLHMTYANKNEIYLLRFVRNSPDADEEFYFDVLDHNTGTITRSVRMPKAAVDLYPLKDGVLCAWNNSFQLFSTDYGKTWIQLPETIRGLTYGCGYGDSMFFLRNGILSEIKGEDIRQGRLEEKIIAHTDANTRSLVVDEASGQFYTVLKKDSKFYVHSLLGEGQDIFLCDDSENPDHAVVKLQYAQRRKFYASADFMKQPFDNANSLIVTDGKTVLRSRAFMGGPEMNGRVNNLLFFYAKTGLEDYVFFNINLNDALQ